ncbi:MAG: eCIS core domain-containing protein [Kofleriaceae bacterium]
MTLAHANPTPSQTPEPRSSARPAPKLEGSLGAAPAIDLSRVSIHAAHAQPAPGPLEGADGTLLVDGAPGPGQLGKAAFFAMLRRAVVAAAEQELAGTDWTAEHCPWIEHWFAYYEARTARDAEAAIHRYAPGTRGLTDAAGYLEPTVDRVRAAIQRWRRTGEIDAPSEVDPRTGGDPLQLALARLGPGDAVPAMPDAVSSVLGSSFGGVEVHTGPEADRLAADAGALALTIGRHIVVGANAPRAGTLEGDALLAHELAHVQQQRGAAPGARLDANERPALESNADAAVAQMAGAHLGLGGVMQRAWSAIRAPLALSRCKNENAAEIERLKKRKGELEPVYARSTSFSEAAAADSELTAIEHWLAVRETGEGPRTGSHSGEAGPSCNCTTYVADVLRRTYAKIGHPERWDAVRRKALSLNTGNLTGLNGIQLQKALIQERGWKAIYFAPDPTYEHYRMRRRDRNRVLIRDAAGNVLWGADTYAEDTYASLRQHKKVHGIQISQQAINYRPEAAVPDWSTPVQSTTIQDRRGLEKLERIPFGVLTVREALHMALLVDGVVYEVHFDKKRNELSLYESKRLEQWAFPAGIVVAPGDAVDKAFGQ